jgi:hypothetical protein
MEGDSGNQCPESGIHRINQKQYEMGNPSERGRDSGMIPNGVPG